MIAKLNKCLEYKLGVLAVAVLLGYAGWHLFSNATPQAQQAAPSEILHSVSTSTITSPVQVYAPMAKKVLRLPKSIQGSATKAVLTATDLPTSKHERTVTTVLDTSTGEVMQYVETKPLKWLSSTSSGAASAYLGLKNLEPALRLQVTQDVFTVKALSFGVHASVDVTQAGRTDTFIGAGARLDW